MTTPLFQEALHRIADCKHNNATELDLSDLDLQALPPQLAELQQLQNLDCSGNQITDLTPLAQCAQLQGMDCDGNQIDLLSSLKSILF